jgi:signal transduction histidine kinase
MYELNKLEESKKIIFSMSKIIDSFVMFHYLSKELQDESDPKKLLEIFMHKVHLESTFNIKYIKIYIKEKESTKKIIMSNDTIEYIPLDTDISKIEKKFQDEIQASNGLCVQEVVNDKKIIVCLSSNQEIEAETLKILEIYTILFISKLENSFLQENIKKQNLILNTKNKELLELQASLIQKEKLASIGQLSAGVAHELNNPIGFISGNFNALKDYAYILKNFVEESINYIKNCDLSSNKKEEFLSLYEDNQIDFILDDLDNLFIESEDGLKRVTNIIKSLKDFSKIDSEGEKEEYSLNQGLESTLTILKNEYKTVANVNLNLDANLPYVRVNGGEINEVLLNIIINGVHAIQNKFENSMGQIDISTSFDNEWVFCKIKDNGSGIKKEIIEKIFDPFFTTKPIGKGSGLGLNISYNIIEKKHNGKLIVSSKENEYTEFEIKLPIN